MFDKAACTDKAVALIREAAANGAELVVFPELFVPCYPYGMTFGFTVGHREESGRADWKRYYDNSLLVPGPETEALAAAARETGLWLSIGVSERVAESGTLYNTNLIFSPRAELVAATASSSPPGPSGWSGATRTGASSPWPRRPGAPWAA